MGVEKAAGIIQTGKKCGCRNRKPHPFPEFEPHFLARRRTLQSPATPLLASLPGKHARATASTHDTHTYIIYIIYATKKIIFLIRITLHEPGHRVPAAPRRDSYTYTAPMAELARAASRVARKNLTAAAFTGQSPRACCCYYLLPPSQNTNHPRNSRTN